MTTSGKSVDHGLVHRHFSGQPGRQELPIAGCCKTIQSFRVECVSLNRGRQPAIRPGEFLIPTPAGFGNDAVFRLDAQLLGTLHHFR